MNKLMYLAFTECQELLGIFEFNHNRAVILWYRQERLIFYSYGFEIVKQVRSPLLKCF